MKTQTKVETKYNCIASSTDLTFSKCNQSYKKARISARSRNFVDALLSGDKELVRKSMLKLREC